MKTVLSHREGPLSYRQGRVRALFLGQDAAFDADLEQALQNAARSVGFEAPKRVASVRQVHSDRVVEASTSSRPEADGLLTRETDLALAVVTADCVPVLLAGPEAVAAVHAGWRGLATEILRSAVKHELAPRVGFSTAWIGPCMAACCYEVGGEVASAVARASGGRVVHEKRGSERPHLALESAAHEQLLALGLEDVRVTRTCTGCRSEWWSYRRLGAKAGRNLSFVWRVG